MHFEILVEDQSGKVTLDVLVPKIIGDDHTFNVKSYKGVGRIPANMNANVDASKRILLANLPKLLSGYGKSWQGYSAVVIVVCDLDDKCLRNFRNELIGLLNNCNPSPETRFCIAVEEGEAWFLGDIEAIKQAYPKSKDAVLNAYASDSICGTWEKLADAVYKGGAQRLSSQGWQVVGAEKSVWAEQITPYMDLDNNTSPSFNYFLGKLRELVEDN
ncbi:MAG: hypothetical protein Q8N35_16015 [Methylococcaceae bacterium]|jgi:hypothetical protein|nr:hypothetical protein [Methylococcaceae bacterium]MDZ4157298.1 hypothetical protein [Methylococcales bacterium]MDP2392588.1 hypothetical protein [Methylococcaceae bacterium]MDP3021088.1 hypothetical protein [Methylococcaceae bacterium]MDP3388475.1 hypothetical protein [Methylococcaceae bacterium]